MPDDDPLVQQLKRVGTGMEFRSWTRRRLLALALAVAADLIATILSVTAILGVQAQARHARTEAVARSRAVCTAANESRRTINDDKAKLVKVFTLATRDQQPPAPLTQAVVDAYADYIKPTRYLDCSKIVAGQDRPVPLLPPGVEPPGIVASSP